MTQKQIQEASILFARKNKTRIAKQLTDPSLYPPSKFPISVFMAGSPGAGKTEFSKNLLITLNQTHENVIRIDGDELRDYFPAYTGKNSKLFQGGISILVDKVHDLALKNSQNFILDGTFWKQDKAIENINRSIRRKRTVFVCYVYQDPRIAWEFTKKREIIEGRNIPKSAFIEQFIGARKTIEHLSVNYSTEVIIYLIEKNYEQNTVKKIFKVESGHTIDHYISSAYTKSALDKIL